eukprot:Skav209221  [mRNA]  locus=scaffold3787:44003:46531:+ [translate_table: standard]
MSALPSAWAVVWGGRLVIFAILYALTGYVAIVPFLVSKGEVIFNAAMALIMEHFAEPKRSEHLGLAVGLGTLADLGATPLNHCAGHGMLKSHMSLPEPQFWSVLPPFVLFVIIYRMLQSVSSKTETLLEKSDNLLAKACGGLYLFKNARVLVLTFELICIFAANNAFLTAAAIELQRNGFSSSWIGVITMPSGLMQCLLSQWAGRVAGSVKNRERILLYTPALLGFSLIFIGFIAKTMSYLASINASVSSTSTLLVPILSTLVVSSAALGAADAPAMSMMADLAASQGLGYGQALTASEMAINAGRGKTYGILSMVNIFLKISVDSCKDTSCSWSVFGNTGLGSELELLRNFVDRSCVCIARGAVQCLCASRCRTCCGFDIDFDLGKQQKGDEDLRWEVEVELLPQEELQTFSFIS